MNESTLIQELNERILSIQGAINSETLNSKLPNTFIVGCPRSGTTALLQYLSSTGLWAYPTNLLTRFSNSIYLGSLVQEVLFNSNFGLIKDKESIDFNSDYGRSAGPLNANEFFHFFRRFFPNNDIRHLNSTEIEEVKVIEMLKEISTVTNAMKKPFLSKGLMLQYNLEYFSKQMPNDIFIYIKRNEKFVMQSIYKARIKETGSVSNWWSAKPKEFALLEDKSPEEQIAGQVYFTNKAIEDGLKSIPEKNKLIIKYEDFIVNPEIVLNELLNKYVELGCPIQSKNLNFENMVVNRNTIKIESPILNKLLTSYKNLLNG